MYSEQAIKNGNEEQKMSAIFASRGSRTPTDWMETSHSTAKLSTRARRN